MACFGGGAVDDALGEGRAFGEECGGEHAGEGGGVGGGLVAAEEGAECGGEVAFSELLFGDEVVAFGVVCFGLGGGLVEVLVAGGVGAEIEGEFGRGEVEGGVFGVMFCEVAECFVGISRAIGVLVKVGELEHVGGVDARGVEAEEVLEGFECLGGLVGECVGLLEKFVKFGGEAAGVVEQVDGLLRFIE